MRGMTLKTIIIHKKTKSLLSMIGLFCTSMFMFLVFSASCDAKPTTENFYVMASISAVLSFIGASTIYLATVINVEGEKHYDERIKPKQLVDFELDENIEIINR